MRHHRRPHFTTVTGTDNERDAATTHPRRPGGAPPDRQILPGGRADVHFLPPSSGMTRRRNRRGGEEGGPAATAADGSALDVDSPRVRRRRQEVDDDARED